MYLSSSTFYISAGATVKFIHNSAVDKGGAIYVEPGITSAVVSADGLYYKCLYHILIVTIIELQCYLYLPTIQLQMVEMTCMVLLYKNVALSVQ